MPSLVIAIDLGTSGIRAQALDLAGGEIIATAITMRHPLPGANVIDHLHFAVDMGSDIAQHLLVVAINQVITALHIPTEQVVRLAVCGNPIQLSLFQGIEIRDLAYAGQRKLAALGVIPPSREAVVLAARDCPALCLPPGCEIVIPPAVRHEIGADTLALIIQTGMLDRDETSLATDYGTNAEIVLSHNGHVFTGSTAAGPALEGQQIVCGMLAAPGAISDLEPVAPHHRLLVLDAEMRPVPGPLVDLRDGRMVDTGVARPVGITGTGTLALVDQATQAGLAATPRIQTTDGKLHLDEGIWFTAEDLVAAGKAIGAVRAGHITLCHAAGIAPDAVQTAYMAGASGTYVDALKAQRLGLVPAHVKQIYQVGNTSLAMARELATDLRTLDMMSTLATRLRETHCMFATSDVFSKTYILELAYWTEGMPLSMYRSFLKRYGLPDLLPGEATPRIIHVVERDIADLGYRGLEIVSDVGQAVQVCFDGCTACQECVAECPENALTFSQEGDASCLVLQPARCNGMACRRCERVCPAKVFELACFFTPTSFSSEERGPKWA